LGNHSGLTEDYTALGYEAVSVGRGILTFRGDVLPPSSRIWMIKKNLLFEHFAYLLTQNQIEESGSPQT